MWEGTNGPAVHSTKFNNCISQSYSSFYNTSFNTIAVFSVSLICDDCVYKSKFVIFQEKLLKVLKCFNFFSSATTTQLLSSGEFCKLLYDTIPVKSASANVTFSSSNSKKSNLVLWHSSRNWTICKTEASFESNFLFALHLYLMMTSPIGRNMWYKIMQTLLHSYPHLLNIKTESNPISAYLTRR